MGANYTNPPTQGAVNMLGAIGTNEGYGQPGTVPTMSNNPGAVTTTNPSAFQYGVANPAGVINYGSIDDGTAAAYSLMNRYVQNNPNITVGQFAQNWTVVPNATTVNQSAITNYANSLGVSPDTPVASILDGTVPTKPSKLNFATTTPPGSIAGSTDNGTLSPSEVENTTVAPIAGAYTPLSNNASNVDVSELVPTIVINEGLNAQPWYDDPTLITGNPKLRNEVQPVNFQVLLHDNNYFVLANKGEVGRPINVQLNASMKSVSWGMKHLYHQQRTRTAYHVTLWGMQADIIEGTCTTGVFMNRFGLTDYYSTRTVNDNLKNLVTSGIMFTSEPSEIAPEALEQAESVLSGATLSQGGGLGGVVSVSQTTGQQSGFQTIINKLGVPQTSAFRVAAQDAFMEFLALFKMNGNVWFWNKTYDSQVGEGENRDWTQVQAWSPTLGLSSSQKNSRNNDVMTRGGVLMSYRNFVYQGYFKTLQWTMDASNPFQWNFSFVFQVERTVGQQFNPTS